jgi:hypothetical protein
MNKQLRPIVHNRFDFVITDVETGEISKAYAKLKPQAENIVLDRMYTRLTAFSTFFTNIVYGSGTGVLSSARTTLFARVGSKAAADESVVRSYPLSVWTRKIRLDVNDNNGMFLREVGISDDATLINTHALITDSEGNPIEIEKTNLKVIDIYATVYVELYDVDSGLQFYSNGLRDYLTGGTAPTGNIMGVALTSSDDFTATGQTKTGIRTVNAAAKSVTLQAEFGVSDWNKDIRYFAWTSVGVRCKIPRTGVFTGIQLNNVNVGTADGVKTTFSLPNQEVSGIVMKVDGVQNNSWTQNSLGQIVFTTAPISGIVTASYMATLFPKSINYTFKPSITIQYAGAQPSPVEPPMDYSAMPGSETPIKGDANYGYFGEVAAVDFINGADLCALLGITAGTLINSLAGWLKVAKDGKRLLLSKMCIRHTISWNTLNALGLVYGEKLVAIQGGLYAVRMLSDTEWNALIYPLHTNYKTWAELTNAQLGLVLYTWTSTIVGSDRKIRGYNSVEYSDQSSPTTGNSFYGFRPILEFIRPL